MCLICENGIKQQLIIDINTSKCVNDQTTHFDVLFKIKISFTD